MLLAFLRRLGQCPSWNDFKLSVYFLKVKPMLFSRMLTVFLLSIVLKAVWAFLVNLVEVRLKNKKVFWQIVFVYFFHQSVYKKYLILRLVKSCFCHLNVWLVTLLGAVNNAIVTCERKTNKACKFHFVFLVYGVLKYSPEALQLNYVSLQIWAVTLLLAEWKSSGQKS